MIGTCMRDLQNEDIGDAESGELACWPINYLFTLELLMSYTPILVLFVFLEQSSLFSTKKTTYRACFSGEERGDSFPYSTVNTLQILQLFFKFSSRLFS